MLGLILCIIPTLCIIRSMKSRWKPDLDCIKDIFLAEDVRTTVHYPFFDTIWQVLSGDTEDAALWKCSTDLWLYWSCKLKQQKANSHHSPGLKGRILIQQTSFWTRLPGWPWLYTARPYHLVSLSIGLYQLPKRIPVLCTWKTSMDLKGCLGGEMENWPKISIENNCPMFFLYT